MILRASQKLFTTLMQVGGRRRIKCTVDSKDAVCLVGVASVGVRGKLHSVSIVSRMMNNISTKLEEEMPLDSWYNSKYSVVHHMQMQEECD